MMVHSSAPLRVDFAGGWSELAAHSGRESGTVVNAAITLEARVDFLLGDRRIRLRAEDTGDRATVESSGLLTYDGKLDHHKAALNMLPVTGGIELLSQSDAPLGSGLGSGALNVALLAGLARCRQEDYENTELAELGFMLETSELGLFAWKQDQYAAAFGGFLELRLEQDEANLRPLSLTSEAAAELAQHTILAYTGHSHFNRQTYGRVLAAFEAGDPAVVAAIRATNDVAREVAAVLESADWQRLATLVDEDGHNQQSLDAAMVTPETARIEAAARAAGAWGLKPVGPGAGGCLLVVCSPNQRANVTAAVAAGGGTILGFDFTSEGVAVWQQPDAVDQP